ncbi:MAG: TolC family protein [Ignavibacteria bacterium]|nr:TolC family protein [Ignavibacteria bacterium]
MLFRVSLILLSSGLMTVAQAQIANLTLSDVRQTALENNISIIQALNNIDAAQSNVTAAYGRYLPTLSASGGWNRYQSDRPGTDPFIVNGVVIPGTSGFSVDNDFRAGVNLNWVLFDGLSREGGKNQATSAANSTEFQSMRTRQTVIFQVDQMYLNILRTEQLVKVAEENLKRDLRQLERIEESNRVGALSLADVYRQQSQVAADEFALINAQNDYDKAQADLIALIGLDVSRTYTFNDPDVIAAITETAEEPEGSGDVDFETLADSAVSHRPDYNGTKEFVSSRESAVTSAQAGYWPSISAGAGYSIQNNAFNDIARNRSLNWGVNFNWTLFNGFATNQAVQSAEVERRNAEIDLVQSERDIRVEIKKALLDLDAARKQVEVTQKGLISAKEDLRIQQERYNLGAGTLLDLLTASAGLVNAEAGRINAIYSYIVSKRNLDYVIGEQTY